MIASDGQWFVGWGVAGCCLNGSLGGYSGSCRWFLICVQGAGQNWRKFEAASRESTLSHAVSLSWQPLAMTAPAKSCSLTGLFPCATIALAVGWRQKRAEKLRCRSQAHGRVCAVTKIRYHAEVARSLGAVVDSYCSGCPEQSASRSSTPNSYQSTLSVALIKRIGLCSMNVNGAGTPPISDVRLTWHPSPLCGPVFSKAYGPHGLPPKCINLNFRIQYTKRKRLS